MGTTIILKKDRPAHGICRMELHAPVIAAKAEPGQFVMIRLHGFGERVPFSIADIDPRKGSITILFEEIGATTRLLGLLETGAAIADLAGPLGNPVHLNGMRTVALVCSGMGCGLAWAQAKRLCAMGADVEIIAGFRTSDRVVLEQELADNSGRLTIVTEDGSRGGRRLVTDVLKSRIESGAGFDAVIASGPLPMLKAVSRLTSPHHIRTWVCMNMLMMDGTGLCGGCRLTVAGEVRFACVDGPVFNGHQVDFDEAIRRNGMYAPGEMTGMHLVGSSDCRLGGRRHES